MKHNSAKPQHPCGKRPQVGLTLVELLVALVISLVVVIAATSSLVVSRRGFNTVDAASQLRDNARFSTDYIQRLGVQSGFSDATYVTSSDPKGASATVAPSIFGFNNSTSSSTDPLNVATANTNTSAPNFGSDVVIFRYQVVETFPGSGVSDNSMIDCFGNSNLALPADRYDRHANVLHVRVDPSTNEPALYCSTNLRPGPQPVIQGVEKLQVLYGVDGVTPNTATPATLLPTFMPTRFLRADQMAVTPDPDGSLTNNNWRRVRSVRVGMVIRGPLGSTQDSTAQTFYPLGAATGSAGGAAGSAMSSASDAGTAYTPTPDTRLRQVVTFTIHLRNELGF